MKEERRRCELCNSEAASIYCPSDSAFLCSNCDVTVHEANFLVARHLRYSLSSSIRHRFDSNLPSSSSSQSCANLNNNNNNNKTTSSKRTRSHYSSSSVTNGASSTTSKKVINLNKKNKTTSSKRTKHTTCSNAVITNGASSPSVTNGGTCSLFVKWSRELELGGVNGNFTAASRALGFCIGKWKGLPFRVAAATSFWFGLRFCGLHDQNQNLITRLEAISGVPAKLILAAHAKLARVFNLHTPHFYYSHFPQHQEEKEEEEGWDES